MIASTNLDDRLLCRLAGELWAVFAPWRGPWQGGGPAVVYFARKSFHEGVGLRWRHGGRGADERVAHVEALGRLERSGMLARHVERTKVTSVCLSEAGIERACALAPACGAQAGWLTRKRVARHLNDGPWGEERGRRWVPEWAMAGTPPDWAGCEDEPESGERRRQLGAVEDMAIPGILRGWIEAGSDAQGRVWYTLGPVEPPGEAPEDVAGEPAPGCSEAWGEGASAMRRRMVDAKRHTELGILPLCASIAVVGP